MSRAVTRAGLVAAAALTLLACATATFHSTWKSPVAGSSSLRGKRVAALVLSEEEELRFAAEEGELVWASQSRAMNPSQVGPAVHELSTKAGTEMEKQGLFGEPALASAGVFPGVGR